jgi:hypothetical protein
MITVVWLLLMSHGELWPILDRSTLNSSYEHWYRRRTTTITLNITHCSIYCRKRQRRKDAPDSLSFSREINIRSCCQSLRSIQVSWPAEHRLFCSVRDQATLHLATTTTNSESLHPLPHPASSSVFAKRQNSSGGKPGRHQRLRLGDDEATPSRA